jgi:zinc transporter ZupT
MGIFGFIIYQPSLRYTIVACLEAAFLVFALGAISLSNGISGADFTETPRPRMIRVSWSFINLGACAAAGAAILAPFFPYALSSMLSEIMPGLTGVALLDPLLAVVVSAIIAIILTAIFYRIALKNARELLTKAEM